jgi:hypothetical protein
MMTVDSSPLPCRWRPSAQWSSQRIRNPDACEIKDLRKAESDCGALRARLRALMHRTSSSEESAIRGALPCFSPDPNPPLILIRTSDSIKINNL